MRKKKKKETSNGREYKTKGKTHLIDATFVRYALRRPGHAETHHHGRYG